MIIGRKMGILEQYMTKRRIDIAIKQRSSDPVGAYSILPAAFLKFLKNGKKGREHF